MNLVSYNQQVLENGLNAAWLKIQTINTNIANISTPGYKTKYVNFEQVMMENEPSMVSPKKGKFRTTVYEDTETSITPDGNNVDMDQQQVELWRTYAQYNFMVDKMSMDFSNLRYAIKNAPR